DERHQLLAKALRDRVQRLALVVDRENGNTVGALGQREDRRVLGRIFGCGVLLSLADRGAHASTSSTTAAPSPPAAHAVARPYFFPRLFSSRSTVVTMRAPVAANG